MQYIDWLRKTEICTFAFIELQKIKPSSSALRQKWLCFQLDVVIAEFYILLVAKNFLCGFFFSVEVSSST